LQGDFNDSNIILDDSCNVSAVVDFGDSVVSWRICDVAIAMAYAMVTMHTQGKDVSSKKKCVSFFFFVFAKF
jgi:Ser/Thr protein kinase RdoA (MazF antagonist)